MLFLLWGISRADITPLEAGNITVPIWRVDAEKIMCAQLWKKNKKDKQFFFFSSF